MKKITLIAVAFAALFVSSSVSAQDGLSAKHQISYTVPKVALVDVEGASTISLTLVAPTEAGEGMDMSASNSDLWLNYSSTTEAKYTNTVSVKTDVTLPGVDLNVQASKDNGQGAGTVGNPNSMITLGTKDQTIIDAIGTCYTGDGVKAGHNLTYSLNTTDYSQINYSAKPTSITVTYTITNN
jgi:hypothetical protein